MDKYKDTLITLSNVFKAELAIKVNETLEDFFIQPVNCITYSQLRVIDNKLQIYQWWLKGQLEYDLNRIKPSRIYPTFRDLLRLSGAKGNVQCLTDAFHCNIAKIVESIKLCKTDDMKFFFEYMLENYQQFLIGLTSYTEKLSSDDIWTRAQYIKKTSGLFCFFIGELSSLMQKFVNMRNLQRAG